jgi:tetratricopeptide (TPR) repeat protein
MASALEIDRLATQLATNPRSKAFLPLAEEYCKAGMWEEAVGVLEDGLKYYPGFITAMVVLGRAYDQLNQPTKARAVLEGAVKVSPENLRAHRTLMILAMNPRDEEVLSLQASLGAPEFEKRQGAPSPKSVEVTGQVTVTPGTNTASGPPPGLESVPKSLPDIPAGKLPSPLDAEKPPQGVAPSSDSDVVTTESQQPSPADTVARLESWLRALERQRRDRLTRDTHSDS